MVSRLFISIKFIDVVKWRYDLLIKMSCSDSISEQFALTTEDVHNTPIVTEKRELFMTRFWFVYVQMVLVHLLMP